MTREYPGNPARRDAIQQEIADTIGLTPARMRCTCGLQPMLVSVAYGLVRVACVCGFQGPNCKSEKKAVNEWNNQVAGLFLESIR